MKRFWLIIRKTFGARLTFEEVATISGKGPCERCVGKVVHGPRQRKERFCE